MTPERARGLQLYALAAAVLIGGGGWFLRAAPYLGEDRRLPAWRLTVTLALPDVQPQVAVDTIALGRGTVREETATVQGGSYSLALVCAGTGFVRVRLSETGADSGRPVRCATDPAPLTFGVGLGTRFYLRVESDSDAAVFRWRLTESAAD